MSQVASIEQSVWPFFFYLPLTRLTSQFITALLRTSGHFPALSSTVSLASTPSGAGIETARLLEPVWRLHTGFMPGALCYSLGADISNISPKLNRGTMIKLWSELLVNANESSVSSINRVIKNKTFTSVRMWVMLQCLFTAMWLLSNWHMQLN